MVRTAQPRNRRRILCKGWSVTRKWPEKHRCISGVLSVPYSGSKAMRKLKKDPIREDRINNEAIVDAYGPEERALGWYYYLKNQLRFPFEAKCSAATIVSPLSKGNRPGPPHGTGRCLLRRYARADPLARPDHGGAPVPNWPESTWTNQPPKPSATGIIG